MDDFDVYGMMQDAGMRMGRKEVLTMLQDLCTMGYLRYEERFDEDRERVCLEKIELTPMGLSIAIRRKSNDEVLFD